SGSPSVDNSIVSLNNANTNPDANAFVGSSGDLISVSQDFLKLGANQNNGGVTRTQALLPGSIAIDGGNDALVPAGITTDQRGPGFKRISGAHVDVGAF